MSSLTLNNMQNSQRKTQINTYGNRDKYPRWEARRRAAGLPSPRSLLGGDQTGLGLTPELVCPFPAPISDASSACHVVSSSLPAELRARGASRCVCFLHIWGGWLLVGKSPSYSQPFHFPETELPAKSGACE